MRATERIFHGIDEMRRLIEQFGNITAFVRPLILPVEKYSAGKMAFLINQKVDWRHDPGKRKKHDGMMASRIIASPEYGEARHENYARICLFLKSYTRARNQHQHLPMIPEGIGTCFLGNIEKFNELLLRLLEFSRPERNRLMEHIHLNKVFIDHYVGQFIFNQFEVHAERLPRPPYGMVRK